MSYKVVRDRQGTLVCFGPNDDNYEPMVKAGETLGIETTQPQMPRSDPILTEQQWRYLLDLTGFGDTLEAVLAAMPKGTAAERKAWAGLKTVATASGSYRLDKALAMVAVVAAKKLPGVILPTEAAIRAAWAEAAAFTGEVGA